MKEKLEALGAPTLGAQPHWALPLSPVWGHSPTGSSVSSQFGSPIPGCLVSLPLLQALFLCPNHPNITLLSLFHKNLAPNPPFTQNKSLLRIHLWQHCWARGKLGFGRKMDLPQDWQKSWDFPKFCLSHVILAPGATAGSSIVPDPAPVPRLGDKSL